MSPHSPTRSLLSVDVGGAPSGGWAHRNPGSAADVALTALRDLHEHGERSSGGRDHTNSGADVFLRDIWAGTTVILSVDADGNALGTVGNSALSAFVFSPDSTRLLFRTQATNIVAGLADSNNSPDWFVRDLLSGTTTCVTINAAGTSTGNVTSFTLEPPVFSPDSSSLAFISLADLAEGGAT
jgi:hypothetical protein